MDMCKDELDNNVKWDEEGNVKAKDEVDVWNKMKIAGNVFFDKIKKMFD